MPVRIALLRAVNLGATRKLSMSRLREALHANGYADARTYIQSGNVVLSSRSSVRAVADDLHRLIQEHFEMDVPVIVRTREQLADIVTANPFPAAPSDGARYYVIFLDRQPPRSRTAAVESGAFEPDEVAFGDRVIYAWYRNGLHASRLAAVLTDAKLGVTSTARNWNTVTRLLAIADEMAASV